MHLIIAINIHSSLTVTYRSQVTRVFSNFRNYEPIPNFFIIRVTNVLDYQNISTQIEQLVTGIAGISVVISPLMQSGKYRGILPPDFWNTINQLSE